MSPTPSSTHVHDVDIEASLDFVNTLEFEDGAPVDHLAGDAGATAWLVDHGFFRASSAPGPDGRAHDRVASVRGALRDVIEAVVDERPAKASALRTLNRVLARHDVLELAPGADGTPVTHRHVGDPVDGALARLIEPVVVLIATGNVDRLRLCANEGCRWAFYDTSRTGQRRWCSMATCGNRAKAARHRARTKGASA
jgi:predicted RNA-binding Zn ribbon-like protein